MAIMKYGVGEIKKVVNSDKTDKTLLQNKLTKAADKDKETEENVEEEANQKPSWVD